MNTTPQVTLNNRPTPFPARTAALDEWVLSPDRLFRACFTDLGEGHQGEWNEDDPTDEPLLRVDVQVSDPDHYAADEDAAIYSPTDQGWFTCHDGSICTNVNADTVTAVQRARLLNSLLVDLNGHRESIKGILDNFSWVRADSADTGPRRTASTT